MKIIQLDRKPRKGDRLAFGTFTGSAMQVTPPIKATSTVERCDGNLCWHRQDGETVASPFIWFFEREQMFNKLAHRFVDRDEPNDLPGSPEGQQAGVSSPPTE